MTDREIGLSKYTEWQNRILKKELTLSDLYDVQYEEVGAMVRLLRAAEEFAEGYDNEFGPGLAETVAWLAEARKLVGKEKT